jgi:hypothetical protein
VGKYSGLKGSLEAPPQDPSYQDQINVEKTKIQDEIGTGIGALGENYNKHRAEKDRLNDLLGKENLRLEALTQLILKKMEDDGVTMVRLADGSSLSMKDEPYSQVSDRTAFLTWVKENGLEDLLTVHFQTMNALVKERLLNGEELPVGVKAFLKSSITRRKA